MNDRLRTPNGQGDERGAQGGGSPVPTTNAFAVASLALGILWFMGIGSILALVFGYVGKNEIDQSKGTQTGRGMAIAGIVLGWIGVGVIVLFVILMMTGMLAMPFMPMMDRGHGG